MIKPISLINRAIKLPSMPTQVGATINRGQKALTTPLEFRPWVKNVASNIRSVYTTPINQLRPRPWLTGLGGRIRQRKLGGFQSPNTNLLANRQPMPVLNQQQKYLMTANIKRRRYNPLNNSQVGRGQFVPETQELRNAMSTTKIPKIIR